MKPTAEQQLQFLQHLQRLFDEGDFVATYKYALLMSLAELAVESGVDEGELELPMIDVAEIFSDLSLKLCRISLHNTSAPAHHWFVIPNDSCTWA